MNIQRKYSVYKGPQDTMSHVEDPSDFPQNSFLWTSHYLPPGLGKGEGGRGKGKGKGGFGAGGFFGDHMVFMRKRGKCHLLPTEYKGRTIEN